MHAAGLDRIVVDFILLPSPHHLASTCHMQAGPSTSAAEQQWLRMMCGAQSSI